MSAISYLQSLASKLYSTNAYSTAEKRLAEAQLLEQNRDKLSNSCCEQMIEQIPDDLLTQPNLNLLFANPDNVPKNAVVLNLLHKNNHVQQRYLDLLFPSAEIDGTLAILALLDAKNLLQNERNLQIFSMKDRESTAWGLGFMNQRDLLDQTRLTDVVTFPWNGPEFAREMEHFTPMDCNEKGYPFGVRLNQSKALSSLEKNDILTLADREIILGWSWSQAIAIRQSFQRLDKNGLLNERNKNAFLAHQSWKAISQGIENLFLADEWNECSVQEGVQLSPLLTERQISPIGRTQKFVNQENFEFMLANPRHAPEYGSIVGSLNKAGLVNQNCQSIWPYLPFFQQLEAGLNRLDERHPLYRNNCLELLANPQNAEEIAFCLIFNLNAAERKKLFLEENRGNLLAHPGFKGAFNDTVGYLEDMNLATSENEAALYNQPKYIWHILVALKKWTSRKIPGSMTQEELSALIANPQYARDIGNGLDCLRLHLMLNPSNSREFLRIPKNIPFISKCLDRLHSEKSLSIQENFDKILSDNQAHVKEIAEAISNIPTLSQTTLDQIVEEIKTKKFAASQMARTVLGGVK